MARLREHQEIAQEDAAQGRTAKREAIPLGPSGAATLEVQKPSVDRLIARLEKLGGAPRDMAVRQVAAYEDDPTFSLGAGTKVRIAPHMIALLYRNNRTAQAEMEEFLRIRGLERCNAAQELLLLGLIIDRLVKEPSTQMVNLPAVEVILRKMYGLIKAFEPVKEEKDWKRPQGQARQKWRSKVRWDLLNEYDIASLQKSEWEIEEADAEIQEKLKKRATLVKHLGDLGAPSAPKDLE